MTDRPDLDAIEGLHGEWGDHIAEWQNGGAPISAASVGLLYGNLMRVLKYARELEAPHKIGEERCPKCGFRVREIERIPFTIDED